LHEEPCTDPYARFCGQTEAAASSDPMSEFMRLLDEAANAEKSPAAGLN
jgi:hypothetical protein